MTTYRNIEITVVAVLCAFRVQGVSVTTAMITVLWLSQLLTAVQVRATGRSGLLLLEAVFSGSFFFYVWK